MKTLAPGAAHSESKSAAFPHFAHETTEASQPRLPRCGQVSRRGARLTPGSPGPVESELNTCNSEKVLGLVADACAELSSAFTVTIDLVASQLADGHLQFFDIDHGTCKFIFLQQVRRGLGLALHSGWAKPMPDLALTSPSYRTPPWLRGVGPWRRLLVLFFCYIGKGGGADSPYSPLPESGIFEVRRARKGH